MVPLRLIPLVTHITTDVVRLLTECPSQKGEDRLGMDDRLLNNYTIEDLNHYDDLLHNNTTDEGLHQEVTRSQYRMAILIHVDRHQEDTIKDLQIVEWI